MRYLWSILFMSVSLATNNDFLGHRYLSINLDGEQIPFIGNTFSTVGIT
jgi:hypothetical protein